MDSITAVAAKKLGKFLAKDFREIFGATQSDEAERLGALARTTIECIARSDALYHTYEHTMLVTIVGRDILRGRTLAHRVEPEDYIHLIVACLLHDIGFVRGVLSGDTKTEFVIDQKGRTVTLPRGASDASLAAYHVDRSKLFVYERLGKSSTIDAARVAAAIELTRFPPAPTSDSDQIGLEPRLVQAADLIGQLGDPLYPRKANALFYEFEETRQQSAVRLRLPRRPGREVSWILLEHRLGPSRGRDEISEPDRLRPPVDRQPPQSHFQRRALQLADGPADLRRPQSSPRRPAQPYPVPVSRRIAPTI